MGGADKVSGKQPAASEPIFQSLFLPTGIPNQVRINWTALGLPEEHVPAALTKAGAA